jgi:hypothetical protein
MLDMLEKSKVSEFIINTIMDSKQHGKISKYVSESVLWVAD